MLLFVSLQALSAEFVDVVLVVVMLLFVTF